MQPKNTIIVILLGWVWAFGQPDFHESEYKSSKLCESCGAQKWWLPEEEISGDNQVKLFQHLGFDLNTFHFKLKKKEEESSNQSHLLFQQHFQGIPVHGGLVKVHLEGGIVKAAHGWYFPKDLFTVEKPTSLPFSQIVAGVLSKLPHLHFAWESPEWEASIKESTGNPNASYYPEPQLAFYSPNEAYTSFALAFKLEIRAVEPDELFVVWVDAYSGDFLSMKRSSHSCQPEEISIESLYYGQREVEVRERGWPFNDYILESCEPWNLSTRIYDINSFGERRSWINLNKITHNQNKWGIESQAASTGHWALLEAMDYFSDEAGWVGPSGRGEETRLLVGWVDEIGQPIPNARYLKDKNVHYIYLGEIDGKSLSTLDIVGHEYAHAFIEEYAGLENSREPGTLSEGLADIFGFLIEKRTLGGTGAWNWTIGEAIGNPLRSLKSPEDFAMPKTADSKDPFWFPNTVDQCLNPTPQSPPFGNDNCGIHQNSSVISHWFYLLTQGGTQNGIEVRPIPIEDAEDILIRTVRYYLLPSSNFEDARQASMLAARDLFSDCSQQIAQLENAWASIGIGNPNISDCISISGSDVLCLDEPSRQYLFEALGPVDAIFRWEGIPDNWFTRIQGERNQFLSIESLPEEIEPINLQVIANWQGKTDMAVLSLTPSDCSQKAPRQADPVPNFDEIRMYPNPALNKVNLFLPDGLFPAEVSIFDARGRRILHQGISASLSAFDLNGWNRGVYVLQVNSSNAFWQSKLLITK